MRGTGMARNRRGENSVPPGALRECVLGLPSGPGRSALASRDRILGPERAAGVET